jgi:hypothetical protein
MKFVFENCLACRSSRSMTTPKERFVLVHELANGVNKTMHEARVQVLAIQHFGFKRVCDVSLTPNPPSSDICLEFNATQKLLSELAEYDKALRDNYLRDHQVASHVFTRDKRDVLKLLIKRLSLVCIFTIAVFPGILLSSPIITATRVYAR